MTDQREENQPNEFGFAGDGTAPEPQPTRDHDKQLHDEAESIAVPAGDITGSVSEAIEDATQRDR
ncbi:hypothetical protein [Actinoplanes sp. RD1]|uniref:hypothetical protein n=1 Tax=Actinoplanes sp. RD1 TaxID=3064538 RepID=UPI002742289B|nr:hypothetical protein [Actinoplanes sp. RD1]